MALCLVYPILSVSLDCPFLIVSSFSLTFISVLPFLSMCFYCLLSILIYPHAVLSMILVYGEQRCVVNRLGVVTVHVYADYVLNSRNVQLNTIIGIYLYLLLLC